MWPFKKKPVFVCDTCSRSEQDNWESLKNRGWKVVWEGISGFGVGAGKVYCPSHGRA
jgi:hypothetical protein